MNEMGRHDSYKRILAEISVAEASGELPMYLRNTQVALYTMYDPVDIEQQAAVLYDVYERSKSNSPISDNEIHLLADTIAKIITEA